MENLAVFPGGYGYRFKKEGMRNLKIVFFNFIF